jgi:RNA polymerase sigma-70 factor (ECF subfamily)
MWQKGRMGGTDEDDADVARVVAGDLAAFEGIVRRWQGRLVGLAWRFCRDRAAAEDMAQEAFLKAFRSLASFRGESAFSTWLTSIALNSYRSRLRAEGPPLLGIDLAERFAVEAKALRGLQTRERAEAVRRAVLTLPARYREAIVLYYFEERDLAQSARVLGVAEGTLKARLHRGRELLRLRCAALSPQASGGVVEGT